MPYRILYAEDDETLAFLTRDFLEQQGYQVEHFPEGKACFDAFRQKRYDLCILDVMLPGMNGFDLLSAIRKENKQLPVIFLSAKSLSEDRLTGLRIGADDYLVKPYNMEELLLKIEIFIKRSSGKVESAENGYRAGTYLFDPANFLLKKEGKEILLTEREAALLGFFLKHKNEALKREQILQAVWGQDDYFYGRSLDVFVSRLRKIFADDPGFRIQTLHGIGFRLHTGAS
jgi:DNA-binding response OmpR family regulator